MNAPQPLELPSHDLLSRLAKDDPKAYEALRQNLVDNFIACAPAHMRSRLQGIQFRIECVRRVSRSALGSTIKTYEMMWASFLGLNDGLQDLARIKSEYIQARASIPASKRLPVNPARVLNFRPPAPRNPDPTVVSTLSGESGV